MCLCLLCSSSFVRFLGRSRKTDIVAARLLEKLIKTMSIYCVALVHACASNDIVLYIYLLHTLRTHCIFSHTRSVIYQPIFHATPRTRIE